jgi:hypothetical protein
MLPAELEDIATPKGMEGAAEAGAGCAAGAWAIPQGAVQTQAIKTNPARKTGRILFIPGRLGKFCEKTFFIEPFIIVLSGLQVRRLEFWINTLNRDL